MALSRLLLGLSTAAAAGAAALLVGSRSAEATARATATAVETGGLFQARLTGYWPFAAKTAAEQRMEGGHRDRKGRPLHTLEQHLADPAAHPYVSVAGDDAIFPYGQLLQIDAWPGAIFRVVDTGGNFRGSNKVYRAMGREPLDVCVATSQTKVTPHATARIIKGDHFDKPGKEIATARFQGQVVAVGGLALLGVDYLGSE